MNQGTRVFRRSLQATGLLVAGGLSLLFQLPPVAPTVRAQRAHIDPTPSVRARAAETLGRQPLGFERNEGQFEAGTKFAARGGHYGIFLTGRDAVLALRRNDNGETAALRMSVVGAPAETTLTSSEPRPGVIRHYRGRGASQLAASTQAYERVTRHNVYDGIDLVYYGNQERLEYDFIVAPGHDPRTIALQFSGADRLEIEPASGDLLLHVAGGAPVRQHTPVTYQVIDGTRREIESRYVLTDTDADTDTGDARVRFEVGAYDATQPLVIDPVLTYSTYFGSLSEELITDIALDAAGKRFGAVVEGIGAAPVQIVVERAMYTSPNGDTWSAGTNAVATKLQ